MALFAGQSQEAPWSRRRTHRSLVLGMPRETSQTICLAVPWHSRTLGFTPRPWPGNPRNPAPEDRIPALRTRRNLRFLWEVSTISAPGWQAGWGTSLAPLGCPGDSANSRILGFSPRPWPGNAPNPARAVFRLSGPGKTFVFLWRGRRFQPRVGRPGGGPVWPP